MTNATFHNFMSEPFTGYWDGKPKTFKPGEKVYMPAWLAEHFAKHLANKHLIENGKEVYASPKNPGQVKQFMDVFRMAFLPDNAPSAAEAKAKNTVDDIIAQTAMPSMDVQVKKPETIDQGPAAALGATNDKSGDGADIIIPPAGDEDDFEAPVA